MVITTKIVFDSNWNVLEHEWFDYTGPVALCCGAPSGQTALAAAQTAAYTQYTANAAAEFQDATGLFKQLTAEYTPIFQAGPNQYGFSAAETNALNTEAASGTAQDYNAVNRAAKETLAAEGGGNTTLPSGVSAKMFPGVSVESLGLHPRLVTDHAVMREQQASAVDVIDGYHARHRLRRLAFQQRGIS